MNLKQPKSMQPKIDEASETQDDHGWHEANQGIEPCFLLLKTVALQALKRKKNYETNIEKINGARMTIETQMMAIENANVNLETMGAMRAGAEAMKNIHGSMYVLHVG